MPSSLMFAMTSERGMRVLEVPSGTFLSMTAPINMDQFEDLDITGDVPKLRALMSDMTIQQVRDCFVKVGADPEDVPKKMKKDSLITRFIDRFERTRQVFETLRPPPSAPQASGSDGRNFAVVSLNSEMSPDEVISEVRRQVPEFENAPRQVVEQYVEKATRIELNEDGAPSSQAPQTSTSVRQTTEAFTGRGYKLSADVDHEDVKNDYYKGMVLNKDVSVDFHKTHIKPDLEVRVLPYENAPKHDYTVDASTGKVYEVEMTEKTPLTKGKAIIKLECQKCQFNFTYHYTEKDKISDVLELIEANTDIKKEQMVLFYSGGRSFFGDWEPIYASVMMNDHNPEMLLCVRALGGGKSTFKPTKKTVLTKQEKLVKAQSVAATVASKEAAVLKCVKDSNDILCAYYSSAQTDPKSAFTQAIDKLSEADLTKALQSIQGDVGGSTEQKLKAFALCLFGEPITEIEDLHGITGGILDTAVLTTSLAFEWGVENGSVSLSFLRQAVRSTLDKRIGAREASHMAT
eukprot:symbB.v1.2.037716.t1/scaffold5646.1/size24984/2